MWKPRIYGHRANKQQTEEPRADIEQEATDGQQAEHQQSRIRPVTETASECDQGSEANYHDQSHDVPTPELVIEALGESRGIYGNSSSVHSSDDSDDRVHTDSSRGEDVVGDNSSNTSSDRSSDDGGILLSIGSHIYTDLTRQEAVVAGQSDDDDCGSSDAGSTYSSYDLRLLLGVEDDYTHVNIREETAHGQVLTNKFLRKSTVDDEQAPADHFQGKHASDGSKHEEQLQHGDHHEDNTELESHENLHDEQQRAQQLHDDELWDPEFQDEQLQEDDDDSADVADDELQGEQPQEKHDDSDITVDMDFRDEHGNPIVVTGLFKNRKPYEGAAADDVKVEDDLGDYAELFCIVHKETLTPAKLYEVINAVESGSLYNRDDETGIHALNEKLVMEYWKSQGLTKIEDVMATFLDSCCDVGDSKFMTSEQEIELNDGCDEEDQKHHPYISGPKLDCFIPNGNEKKDLVEMLANEHSWRMVDGRRVDFLEQVVKRVHKSGQRSNPQHFPEGAPGAPGVDVENPHCFARGALGFEAMKALREYQDEWRPQEPRKLEEVPEELRPQQEEVPEEVLPWVGTGPASSRPKWRSKFSFDLLNNHRARVNQDTKPHVPAQQIPARQVLHNSEHEHSPDEQAREANDEGVEVADENGKPIVETGLFKNRKPPPNFKESGMAPTVVPADEAIDDFWALFYMTYGQWPSGESLQAYWTVPPGGTSVACRRKMPLQYTVDQFGYNHPYEYLVIEFWKSRGKRLMDVEADRWESTRTTGRPENFMQGWEEVRLNVRTVDYMHLREYEDLVGLGDLDDYVVQRENADEEERNGTNIVDVVVDTFEKQWDPTQGRFFRRCVQRTVKVREKIPEKGPECFPSGDLADDAWNALMKYQDEWHPEEESRKLEKVPSDLRPLR